jgi:transcription initiation factor IIF auxiliary subunit
MIWEPTWRIGSMSLKLKNRWKLIRDDWWEWECFLDDEATGELSSVAYVKYVLHPTFSEPIRVVRDPTEGFVLRTEGWGEFDLKAFVYMQDGTEKKLTHEVKLKYDPPQGVSMN